ncbi:MAG: DUF3892 domain-containing protein [Gammaproteobacteria bacterium]|nr:DUF3892 domain-containing protein [Gammaproteobacteria bacterium]
MLDCLRTTYINSSLDDLVEDYAPAKDGNNVKKYRKFLHDETGVTDNKKVKDFTPSEFDKLWRAIEKIEGYEEGIIIEVFPVTQVHKNKNGICDYNIKNIGWVSKAECLKLAKQGKLDLVVCSHLGNEYLRTREKSTVNDSLNNLVIKDKKKEG